MKLQIGICDDELTSIKNTRRILTDYLAEQQIDYDLHIFSNPSELKDFLLPEYLDLLFLDIRMPEADGITTARYINGEAPFCQIIFLTSFIEYATEVYETEHCYFVLKTQLTDKLPSVISAALRHLNDAKKDRLVIYCKGSSKVIFQKDIIYIERRQRTSYIYLITGKVVTTTDKLPILAERLNPHYLVQCHTSFIVNLFHVKEYCRNYFLLHDNKSITISRKYSDLVRATFTSWSQSLLTSFNKRIYC